MDTAVEFSLSVFEDRLVEGRVRIGAGEDKLDVRKANVIITIILIASITALCNKEESTG